MDADNDAWQEKLDEIVAGEKVQPTGDDELLAVALRLREALAPLRNMDRVTIQHRQNVLSRLYARHTNRTHLPVQHFSWSWLRIVTLLALVLLIGSMSIEGLEKTWERVTQVWHTSTSFDQIKGVSVASLSRPHAGIKPLPLLPSVLPSDTQASSYGVITATSNPNVLTTFVADYHIAGQDVLLYEQPSQAVASSSIAKVVRIGMLEGQLFQDDAGNNAIQWYQNGMMCQLTSTLSSQRLVILASTFQRMTNWDVLL